MLLEIRAAAEAGMQTAIISRPGNAPLDNDATQSYRVWTSFEPLFNQGE
jgi:methionine salvage enolase-phosphatase E1